LGGGGFGVVAKASSDRNSKENIIIPVSLEAEHFHFGSCRWESRERRFPTPKEFQGGGHQDSQTFTNGEKRGERKRASSRQTLHENKRPRNDHHIFQRSQKRPGHDGALENKDKMEGVSMNGLLKPRLHYSSFQTSF
jgi:hypothetical protein